MGRSLEDGGPQQIAAETPPGVRPETIERHSVVIADHRTSVSLERAFWDALRAIAARRGIAINKLITEVDSERRGNLSSALRLYVLAELRADASVGEAVQ